MGGGGEGGGGIKEAAEKKLPRREVKISPFGMKEILFLSLCFKKNVPARSLHARNLKHKSFSFSFGKPNASHTRANFYLQAECKVEEVKIFPPPPSP